MEELLSLNKNQTIGVFGGTFDPPHIGHLILAEEAVNQLHLDQFLWVLTPTPPHKYGRLISNIETRIRLVEAAIESNPTFKISRVDINRPAPHFAVDTLRLLRREFLDSKLIYLIGGDSFHDLPNWHQPEVLLDLCHQLGVMRRPQDQVNLGKLLEKMPGLEKKLIMLEAPEIQISASDIRSRIIQKKAFRYFVPSGVFRIIEAENLYSSSEANF